MTAEHLVVARLKTKQPGENVRFTRTGTVEELLEEVNRAIPCDTIYFVVPHPDGKGYSFREAGRLIIDLQVNEPLSHSLPPEPPTFPQPVANATAPSPIVSPPVDTTPYPPDQDLNLDHPRPSGEEYVFEPFAEPAKSQSQWAAEKGLIDPPLASTEQKKTKKGKSVRKSSKISNKDPNDKDDPSIPLEHLPHPRAGIGSRTVRSISTATPAQAAAASHFKGF